MESNYRSVYITCKDEKEAIEISTHVLNEKLCACSNILEGMKSFYLWKGEITNDKEAILILKTKKQVMELLINEIKAKHSYEVPCIVSFPIMEANKEYLEWIDDCVKEV